jgi:hypothetical protein
MGIVCALDLKGRSGDTPYKTVGKGFTRHRIDLQRKQPSKRQNGQFV